MLQTIREHLSNKKYPEAFKLASKQIAETPESRDALHLGALAAMRVGDLANAETWFQKAMLIAPEDPVLAMNYAQLHINKGELQKAKAGFKNAAQLNPNAPQPHASLGHLAALSGDLAGAEELYMTALRADANSIPALLGRAHLLLDRNDVKLGLELANRAGKIAPKDPRVQLLLGRAMATNGNLSFARKAFENALQLEPRFFAARVMLARTQIGEGDLQGAAESIEIAGKIAPKIAQQDSAFLLCRADLLLRERNYALAALDLDAVLSKAPVHRAALPARLMVYRAMGQQVALLAHLDSLCVSMPEDVWINHLQLNHQLELAGADAALAAATLWTERAPKNAYAWVHYASLLENVARLDEAKEAAETCLALDASVVQAMLIAARAKLRLGRPNEALQLLNTALTKEMDAQQQFNTLSLRGRVQDALGARAEALSSWQQGAKANPVLAVLRTLPAPVALDAIPALDAQQAGIESAPETARVLFLVGTPMSGIEAVSWHLSGCKGVQVLGDRHVVGGGDRQDLLSKSSDQRYDSAFKQSDLIHIRSRYLRALRRVSHPKANVVVDWLPSLDSRQFQVLRAAVPNARWLIVQRDARDCLLSCLTNGAAGVPCQELTQAAALLESIAKNLRSVAELSKADPQVSVLNFDGSAQDLRVLNTLGEAFGLNLAAEAGASERYARGNLTMGGLPAYFPNQRWQAFSSLLENAFKAME